MIEEGDDSSGSHDKNNKRSFQSASSGGSEKNFLKDLASLIQEDLHTFLPPYKSKFELKSINSQKSRQSRDSDLMNQLGKQKSSQRSRPRNNSSMHLETSFNNTPSTPKSNEVLSEEERSYKRLLSHKQQHIEILEMKQQALHNPSTPLKIHNCVCFVAEQCLSYNCNCFLSPFPCTPECCPNCLNLKSNLPLKVSNVCNCKKTKCLKLYCECLVKGLFCSIMCTCELCENHQHSKLRKQIEPMIDKEEYSYPKGCSCKKINCDKKYCECYAQNMKCTSFCKCVNCNNAEEQVSMDIQIPQEKKTYIVDVPEMAFQPPDLFGENKKKKK